MPRRTRRPAGPEQRERVTGLRREPVERQGPQAYGGQLDGQGQAVQAAAERGGLRAVGVGQGEAGRDGGRPLDEQGQRVAVPCGVGRREGQGRYGEDVFAGYVQGLSAGGQDRQAGGPRQQRAGQRGAGVEQVLAGVQDQQQFALGQVCGERVQGRAGRLHGHAERVGDGLRQQVGVTEVRQFDAAGAVRVVPGRLRGGP